MREHHRPLLAGQKLFDEIPGDIDPSERAAIGTRIATVLVRGPANQDDSELVKRIVNLADDHGLELIAEFWSTAAPESLAGALWRLYVLRTWVHREPRKAATECEAGKQFAPVAEVVAGVANWPNPEEIVELIDTVLAGLIGDNLDVALDRAGAFAQLVALGRSELFPQESAQAARLFETANALHAAAQAERAGVLN